MATALHSKVNTYKKAIKAIKHINSVKYIIDNHCNQDCQMSSNPIHTEHEEIDGSEIEDIDDIFEWFEEGIFNFDFPDWTIQQWKDFVNFAKMNIPQYNERYMKYFAIYIENIELIQLFSHIPSNKCMLIFAINTNLSEFYQGKSVEYLFNELVHSLTVSDLYDCMFQCFDTDHNQFIDEIFKNEYSLNLIRMNKLSKSLLIHAIRSSDSCPNTYIFHVLKEYQIPIPSNYNLIPELIRSDMEMRDKLNYIKRFVEDGMEYDHDECYQLFMGEHEMKEDDEKITPHSEYTKRDILHFINRYLG